MYYHVSKKYLGEKVVLTPRVPETCLVSEEGDIPRICTSRTLLGCIRGIVSHSMVSVRDFIYEIVECEGFNTLDDYLADTKKMVISPPIYVTGGVAYTPPNASDFRANKEMWFLEDTEFVLIGYIDLALLMYTGELAVRQDIQSVALYGMTQDKLNKPVTIAAKTQSNLNKLAWAKLKESELCQNNL